MNGKELVTIKDLVVTIQKAHDEVHRVEHETRARELQLSDVKFAKANEVREQIDQERNKYATTEALYRVEKQLDTFKAWMVGGGTVLTVINIVIAIIGNR